jgi:hypothetical protein
MILPLILGDMKSASHSSFFTLGKGYNLSAVAKRKTPIHAGNWMLSISYLVMALSEIYKQQLEILKKKKKSCRKSKTNALQ